MSRSCKKTPISDNTTASSDAWWKVRAARKLRRHAKALLNGLPDDFPLIGKRWELVDPWSSEKDGKGWMEDRTPESMRK